MRLENGKVKSRVYVTAVMVKTKPLFTICWSLLSCLTSLAVLCFVPYYYRRLFLGYY